MSLLQIEFFSKIEFSKWVSIHQIMIYWIITSILLVHSIAALGAVLVNPALDYTVPIRDYQFSWTN